MEEIHFPDWAQWLERADRSERQRQSWAITVRWYLSFCRRGRGGVDHQTARDFIAWAQQTKSPEPWQLESWREALRWFFRTAKAAHASSAGESGPPRETGRDLTMAEPNASGGLDPAMPAWKRAFLTTVRRRHYSYRTEQSYLVWLERFARFLHPEQLEQRGADDIKAFLDHLASDQRLSASRQRQALNAVVFLLREVCGKELGDFSDYRRAGVAGVWLPEALARKYPRAGEEWPWFWVWSEKELTWDPRGSVRRRHQVSDRAFQSGRSRRRHGGRD